jgi:56kDa selenium binding protein (SBP56)
LGRYVRQRLVESVRQQPHATLEQLRQLGGLFLTSEAVTVGSIALGARIQSVPEPADEPRTFAIEAAARKSPRESPAYVTAVYAGADVRTPGHLATIDLDPKSPTLSRMFHSLPMPYAGVDSRRFGWKACASCQGQRTRRFLSNLSLISSRIHIVDTSAPTRDT